MAEIPAEIEDAIAKDRALFAHLFGHCYWCRDIRYVSDMHCKNRLGMHFCSKTCRQEWRKADANYRRFSGT